MHGAGRVNLFFLMFSLTPPQIVGEPKVFLIFILGGSEGSKRNTAKKSVKCVVETA